jgi:hypothetical protein
LKKSLAFFENAGEEILRFGRGAGNFAKKSAKAAYKYMREQAIESLELFQDAGEELEKLGSTISEQSLRAYEKALGKAKGIVEKTSDVYRKIKKKGERILFMTMETLWDFAKEEAKLKYLKKLGKKVKKYWEKKLKEAEKTAKELGEQVKIFLK